MTVFNAFVIPTLGMSSQSHALNTIGNNIANVNTGGFKRTDTRFSTVLSDTYFQQSDIGGTLPKDYNRISVQGLLTTSTSNFDVAINGDGYFALNSKQDGSGEALYTRDGGFGMVTGADTNVTADDGSTITVKEGYLVDKNNYYVQGYAWDSAAGDFSTTLSSMRVDQYSFANTGIATTTAKLAINLPSNNALVSDHAASVAGVLAGGTAPAGLEVYNIDVIDSAFAHQSVSLYFSKNATNTWDMSYVTTRTPVAQVDTVTLGGAIEAGDTYTVTINGTPYQQILVGGETLSTVRDALVTQINADATLKVTAAPSGADALTLTSDVAGDAVTTLAVAVHGGVSVAQSDSITIGGTFELGDVYTATVNGNLYSYTSAGPDASNADAATGLAALINADPAVAAAAVGNVITITASTAGTAYALTAVGASGGVDATQTAAPAVVTANYTALADNTATVATTTANVLSTGTSAITPITFTTMGTLTSPSSIALAMTFAGGSTGAVTLDTSEFVQYAGDLMPFNYTRNGYAAALMNDFEFTTTGEIVGNFHDSSYRSIYKIPLAQFTNPDAMDRINGNVYAETAESGTARLTNPGTDGYASLSPFTHEISNVDLADEFTKMIMTQTAYNASANVFKTVDEMTKEASSLKR
ncbi:MAG: hypothetical protein A3G18_13450 [Rhodospirillales bacterium RIFCSPLOWO2_12_FULL_58_28]|nr:MAG: hypothetical protein A3H92_13305 [Rhodospirillales bacterium RIFCSPLOWO2_02_FULL_58_16]OHC78578.1 MAG: hypothetical protein A3G18_13450 [Rhodospirillales bacterium RIFCSPLOWO2_12_FULL_58_28]